MTSTSTLRRQLLLAAALAPAAIGRSHAADPLTPPPEFSADQARRDLRILERAFTALHPGLVRYATPDAIQAAFAAANAAVAQGASRAQLYLLATQLAAAVRCGHTWTNPSNQPPAVQALLDGADKLPVTLRGVHVASGPPRWLVTGSAVPGLAAGAEVLAIDGRTPGQITTLLLPYLRADGANDGKRIAQIDHDANGGALDRLLPLLQPPAGGMWQLRVRNAGSNAGNEAGSKASRDIGVPATTVAERTRRIGAAPPGQAWTMAIDGDTARLTLPTFAFWDRSFDGRAFLDRAFATLATQRVPYLVIDIRANEGGDDALGNALLAHLIAQPFTVPGSRRESAYERVPYVLARYLDTWDFGFFDRTGQVSRASGPNPGRNWLLPDAPPRRVEPVALPYRGKVLLLVGPQNSSAGYTLARDVKASGAALLVGRPTGGNQRGLNGGQLAWVTLPASGVAVDIPLVANFTPGDLPDGGVVPDVLVSESFDAAAAGVDADMQAADSVIERWRNARWRNAR